MTGLRIVRSALPLVVFAVLGALLVGAVHLLTRDRIQANEDATLLMLLHSLLPEHTYDNQILEDARVLDGEPFNSPHQVIMYPAFLHARPTAVVFRLSTPDGYNGPIHLLIGIKYDTEQLLGVRVLAHRETPGLGDKIELSRSDWILQFFDRSIGNPILEQWQVKKDGGMFDQFTGATVTPRAVVGAIRRCLLYFSDNKEKLFSDISPKVSYSS